MWACSKQGVFVNKSKIFVIISRCYGSCENIRVVIFGERLHSPLFRNKRFGELSGFLETLFFFKSHAASTIRSNMDIYFMVECHIATCPDDHMAV